MVFDAIAENVVADAEVALTPTTAIEATRIEMSFFTYVPLLFECDGDKNIGTTKIRFKMISASDNGALDHLAISRTE